MSQQQIEKKYLESFMDRDVRGVLSAEKAYVLHEKRASIKAKIRLAETPEEKSKLKEELGKATKQIEEK